MKKNSFFSNVVLVISFLFSFSAFSETKAEKVHQILKVSHQVAGKTNQMGKRAMVLLHLFEDSKKEFRFAAAISHLTLAIERSATNARAEKALNAFSFYRDYPLGDAFHDWGMGLKEINREMVKRIHFAYQLTKWAYLNQIALEDIYPEIQSEEAKVLFVEMSGVFAQFMEIHEAAALGLNLSYKKQREHFEAFVNWEHSYFIQPRMQRLFDRMPPMMQYFLTNVPDKMEALADVTLRLRTSFSLKCTGPENKLLTTNFMDDEIRKSQARAFYDLFESIDFDPSYDCFSDDYYITEFPYAFEKDPKKFITDYYQATSAIGNPYDTRLWMFQQYRDVPLEEFAKMPHPEVPVSSIDRIHLRMDSNPIERNKYINQTYYEISKDLQQCTSSQGVGNWYHFAVWASVSGGKVIDGSKFKIMRKRDRLGLWFSEFMDWTNKEYMIEVFERANTLIALEMIPLGKHFVNLYCGKNATRDFTKFSRLFSDDSKHDLYVKSAFYQYFLAINESSEKIKTERMALASTLQVMGEQIRVDDNLDAVFKMDSMLLRWAEKSYLVRKGDFIIRLRSTQQGALQIGQRNAIQVPLHEDVSTQLTHSHLQNIELKAYRDLLDEYALPYRVDDLEAYPGTATEDWSSWPNRFKFLAAMFRSVITSEQLQQAPY